MAKEVVFQLKVDTGQTTADIIELQKRLSELKRGTALGDINDQFEELNAIVSSGKLGIDDLNKAIQAFQSIALKAGETTPLGQEAIQRAAQLTDRIGDLRTNVQQLSLDASRWKATMQLSNTLINGYQAFTGLTALLGGEQSKLVEVMAKMQIVQQTLVAVEEIRAALEKQTLLSTTARTMWTKALSSAMGFLSKQTLLSATATRVFGKALIATGIGAIVVGIGLLISNLDKLIALAKKVANALGLINLEHERAVKAVNDRMKAEKKLMDDMVDRYNREIELARAAGKDTIELERQKYKAVLERVKSEVELFKQKKALGEKFTQDDAQRAQELLKIQRDALHQLKLLDIREEKERQERAKQRLEQIKKEKEQEREEEEKEKQRKAEFEQKAFEREMILREMRLMAIKDEGDRKLALFQFNHEKELNDLQRRLTELGATEDQINNAIRLKRDQQQLEFEEAQKEVESKRKEEAHAQRIADLEFELAMMEDEGRLRFELEQQLLNERLAAGLITERQYAIEESKLKRQQLEFDKRVEEARFKVRVDFANALTGLLQTLADNAREGSRLQKTAAITAIAADQAVAFVTGLRLAQDAAKLAPDPVSKGIIFGTFYAGQVAAIIKAVSKAKQILGGAPELRTPTFETPRFNTSLGGGSGATGGFGGGASGGFTGVTAGGFSAFSANTVRVVVVESDITQVQQQNQQVKVASQI